MKKLTKKLKVKASPRKKLVKPVKARLKVKAVASKKTRKARLKVKAEKVVNAIKVAPTKPAIMLNTPTTAEQQAGIPKIVQTSSFEGVKKLDDMSFKEQLDTVFNPLHTITKTTVSDAVSDATFIVEKKPEPTG